MRRKLRNRLRERESYMTQKLPVGSRGLAAVLSGLLLAACGGNSILRDNIQAAHEDADALIGSKVPPVPTRGLVVTHSGPYVSPERVARSESTWLHEPVSVRSAGLPFDLCLEEALAQLAEPPSVAFAVDLSEERTASVTLDHRGGSFAEFLDLLADASGYGWEIRAGALYWMAEVTRTFEIRRVPATLSYSVTSGSDQQQDAVQLGTGGSGGIRASPRGNAQISLTSAGAFWDGLEETLTQLLGAGDRPPVIDRATGTVVLRGHAGRVRRAGSYIAALNQWLGRQVLLEVQLVTVSLSDEQSSGIDWSLVQTATSADGLAIAPVASSTLAELGAQTLGITPAVAGIAASTGEWAGTSLILRALSAQGRTSVVNSPRLVVLNGQAAQLQVLNDRGILSGIDVITRESAALATEVQLEAGVVSTGIAVTILPKIVGDEVFLHANIIMSDLVEVNTAGMAGQTIQLPTVERNQFFQSARLRTGQTLALGGLLEDRAVDSSETIARFRWLGAANNATQRTETVLLITPWLLDRPGPSEDALL